MQAIGGFCLISFAKVIANELGLAGESFRAGFTVFHCSADLRKETIEDSVERGNDVFGRSKCPSETFVQRSFPTTFSFQKIEGANAVCALK